MHTCIRQICRGWSEAQPVVNVAVTGHYRATRLAQCSMIVSRCPQAATGSRLSRSSSCWHQESCLSNTILSGSALKSPSKQVVSGLGGQVLWGSHSQYAVSSCIKTGVRSHGDADLMTHVKAVLVRINQLYQRQFPGQPLIF